VVEEVAAQVPLRRAPQPALAIPPARTAARRGTVEKLARMLTKTWKDLVRTKDWMKG
jgi:hypothetical protein